MLNRLKQVYKNWSTLIIYILSLLIRIPSLGYDNINSDAFLWKQRGYQFTSAITGFKLSETLVTYHPGVTLLYNLFISNKLYSVINKIYFHDLISPQQVFFINHSLQKFVIVVFTSILIVILYILSRKLMGVYKASMFIVLLVIEPFFIALTREIHTDGIETLVIAITLLSFYLYINQNNLFTLKNLIRSKYYLICSIFLGLSLLTKSSALIVPFYLFIYTIFMAFKDRKFKFIELSFLFGLGALVFIILWPVMVTDPINALNEYFIKGIKGVGVEEGHEHIWFGKLTLDPGPLFYPIVLLARYSIEVIYMFIVFIVYLIFNFKNVLKKESFIVFVLLFFATYIVIISASSKKLDRYSLVLFPPLLIVSVYYIDKFFKKNVINISLVILIIVRVIYLWALTPDYLAYYSPLIGGIENGMYVVEPKWPVGYLRVAEYFNKQKDAKNLKIAIAEHDYIRPFGIFQTLNIKHESEADQADYIVLPVYRQARNEYYINRYGLLKPKEEITIAGVPFYLVYKNNKIVK